MVDNYKDLIIFSKNGSGDDDRRNYLLLILQKEMILKLIFLNLDYKLVQLNDILSYFASCEITGSSDSSIKNITINDLEKIINESKITHIYTNGNLADKLYHQYFDNKISLPVTKLPSSSPANDFNLK